MIKVLCQKGFAMMEFSLSLLTSLSIAVFFVSLIYTAAAKLWLNQLTYDAVICLAQGRAAVFCEQNLKSRAKWVGARAEKPHWKNRSRYWAVHVEWKLLRNIELTTQRELRQGVLF